MGDLSAHEWHSRVLWRVRGWHWLALGWRSLIIRGALL